ncbi:phytoene desaturase family protein [Epidermidibacterium keratini]|uniref:phytoene desaturase family protein n=1 Tax=Epidermidibacterium keratini TaxID=1891644 RepID=UPI001CEFA48E|nr:phytoene desaturase family protein [Epidermidibacterium keratini]
MSGSDHVVVVGAGFAGLSAALHLSGAGREVTLIDAGDAPGGLCATAEYAGLQHDFGPTVLTAPDILARPFEAVGATLNDHLELLPVDGGYAASYADGSMIEAATPEGVGQTCGPEEAARFADYLDWTARIHDAVFERFMNADFDSPLDVLSPDLARLAALGGFRSLDAMARRRLDDERTVRLATFQALYAGLSPRRARALYGVISYLDLVGGVYLPRGGISTVPQAMLAAAHGAGVRSMLGRRVRRVLLSGDHARGVELDDGERIPAGAVVLATERTAQAPELLGRAPVRRRLRFAPSCVVVSAEVPLAAVADRAHHTLVFGAAWERTFDELTRRHTIPRDLSLLVSIPAITDASLAISGRASLYALAPVPGTTGSTDWATATEPLLVRMLNLLQARGFPVERGSIRHVTGPPDWTAMGQPHGTPFSLAHTFSQTGPFRPRNTIPGLRNVVCAGAGTVPGVGIPTTLLSGELAAQRLLR